MRNERIDVSSLALRATPAGFVWSADGMTIRKAAAPKISKLPSIAAQPMMVDVTALPRPDGNPPARTAAFDFGASAGGERVG